MKTVTYDNYGRSHKPAHDLNVIRTKGGQTVSIMPGEITGHDNSSGDRWDEQTGHGDNGCDYRRRRNRPDCDHVRDNYGASLDAELDRDETLGWGPWGVESI